MRSEVKRLAEEYKTRLRKKIRSDFIKVANEVNNEMFTEVQIMFDSFIRQFYSSYLTEIYVRHGQVYPGTGTGENLYNGKQFRRTGGYNPTLTIDFNGSKMSGDYPAGGSPDQVLESVMNGIRFPFDRPHGVAGAMTWVGDYSSTLTGRTYHGTMLEAFNDFVNNFDDIVEPIFYQKWAALGWPIPKR